MTMFVIYEKPSDFPDHWVVRRWTITDVPLPTSEKYIRTSLEAARECVPKGMVCLHRHENDDPAIKEVWL